MSLKAHPKEKNSYSVIRALVILYENFKSAGVSAPTVNSVRATRSKEKENLGGGIFQCKIPIPQHDILSS